MNRQRFFRPPRFGSPVAATLGLLILVSLLAACARGDAAGPEVADAPIPFDPCHLAAPGLSGRLSAECGTFDVPEDRTRPMGDGNRISLRVARLPAVSRSRAPDALVFLAGGPGQAATESYVPLANALSSINRKRDVLLVDQRGTGGSNALVCPEAEARLAALDETEEVDWEDPEVAAKMAAECLAELPGDPRYYTTAAAVADLEDVRAALGYDSLDLLGVSYGTRVAQRYLATFPERVRLLVLDGVVPPDMALGADVAPAAQAALDAVLARCAAQPACVAAFGDPAADFAEVLDRLADETPRIELVHPTTGETTSLRLTRAMAAGATRLLLYAPETVALLPLLFDRAARGDLEPLAAQVLLVDEALDASITSGLSYAVSCAEDAPFFTAAEADARAEGTFLGNQVSGGLLAICADWPAAEGIEPPAAIAPSDVPALLLSGAEDPVTPPAYAERAAASLPNARLIVAPGQGHNVVARGCLPRLVTAFVETADAQALETDCLATMSPTPFLLGPAGPYLPLEEEGS
jgi:pimeloyl-ACP methyl ester carboxylesterase